MSSRCVVMARPSISGAGAGPADTLNDVEDDAGEAILFDPDLLVVGDLAQSAKKFLVRYFLLDALAGVANSLKQNYGMSVPDVGKGLGQVADIAPPYKGVLIYGAIVQGGLREKELSQALADRCLG